MNTYSKLKKLAGFPNPFSLGMKALGSTLARPAQAIGRTAANVAKIPGMGDRTMGALAGATLGADQTGRATDSTGGAWTGAAAGALAGGAFGLSGRRAGGVSRPVQRMAQRTLVGGGAGQIADIAADNLGYQTNFAGYGAAGGALAGDSRVGRFINRRGNQVISGSVKPAAYLGDKMFQGWRKLKGLPADGGKSIAELGGLRSLPKAGTNSRAVHNIGVGLGAVPVAAGAYGIASGLGDRALNSAADTIGQNVQGQMDEYLGARIPQLTQYAQEAADQYTGSRLPVLSQFVQGEADNYAGTRLPALTQAGLQQLREKGLLSRDGGVRVNVLPDWMRNPSQAAPAQWLRGLYQQYMNQPRQNGVG